MPYNAKTDWKQDDPVTEVDINRWEQGIADAHTAIAVLTADVSNLKTRVNVIESTLPENFLHNQFKDDLSTIIGVKVIRGYYNKAQSRLEV